MIKHLRRYLSIFIIALMPLTGWPQPGDPGGDPDAVPISGIEWLIIAGGLLGAKKIHDLRKRKTR